VIDKNPNKFALSLGINALAKNISRRALPLGRYLLQLNIKETYWI
jgi:hypothetical protein